MLLEDQPTPAPIVAMEAQDMEDQEDTEGRGMEDQEAMAMTAKRKTKATHTITEIV